MSITLTVGATSIVLPQPEEGYLVRVHTGIHVTRRSDGGFAIWDDGATYDHYTSRVTWTVPDADTSHDGVTLDGVGDVLSFFRSATTRGEAITMALGASATGFWPFGPTKGDLGSWTVRARSVESSAMQQEPYGWFQVTVELLLVTPPAYTPAAVTVAEGTFTVDSVTTLRWPDPDGFEPETEYAVRTDMSRNGTAYVLDNSTQNDAWVSSWVQPMHDTNAAALLAAILSSGRGADISIITPAKYWTFGGDQTASDTYTSNLVLGDESGTVLELTHHRYGLWTLPLRYWMQARV